MKAMMTTGFSSMDNGLEPLWKDRPVFFYDQLGCGKSDRAPDKNFYSVENYVAELAEVRAALKLDDVFLMGTTHESFDSRYWGPVKREAIIGYAVPLL